MEGFVYFPTVIYRDEKPEFLDNLKSMCYDMLQEEKKRLTDHVLVQTRDISEDYTSKKFCNYILEKSSLILHDQGYDISKCDFFVSGLWFQELNTGASTNIHVHKGSQISGWLFIDTPENGSIPLYYDPRMNKEMIELNENIPDEVTNATSVISFENVCPGTVLFNNSWLRHQMTTNMSSSATRTLHFTISHCEKRN